MTVMNLGDSFVRKKAQVSKLELRDSCQLASISICGIGAEPFCDIANLNAMAQKYLHCVSSEIVIKIIIS